MIVLIGIWKNIDSLTDTCKNYFESVFSVFSIKIKSKIKIKIFFPEGIKIKILKSCGNHRFID